MLDLFCGVGLLGIALADKCHEVYGVELVEDAVVNAQANAQLNGLDNCHFFQVLCCCLGLAPIKCQTNCTDDRIGGSC